MEMEMDISFTFGPKWDTKRNVTFYDETTLVFIAGKLCILLDLEHRKQSLIRIVEGYDVSVIKKFSDHLALAVQGEPPFVCLYNITSQVKKLYYGPPEMKSNKYTNISISVSHKFVAAAGHAPDWLVVIWLTQTRSIVSIFNPTADKEYSLIHDLSFHANGREELIVVGKEIFRFYEYQETLESEEIAFSETVLEKYENEECISIAFAQKENLVVGTSNGSILIFRGVELVKEIYVSISVTNALNSDADIIDNNNSTLVSCLVVSPKELFCVFGGTIIVCYRGEEIAEYEVNKIIILPKNKVLPELPGTLQNESSSITYLDLNFTNCIIIASTNRGELAYLNYNESQETICELNMLLHPQHAGPIRAMSVARGKPLIATCSEKNFILWNYATKMQEMYVTFRDEIYSLCIHPTGLYLTLNFKHFSRVCTITCRGLENKKILQVRNCTKASFSNGGHLLVLANNDAIVVYCFITYSLLAKLKGHADVVTDLVWKDNDTKLISCDARGIICEWNASVWNKVWENTSTLTYNYLAISSSDNCIFALSKEKIIKCLSGGQMTWELPFLREVTAIAVNPNYNLLYYGTKDGCLGRLLSRTSSTLSETFAHSGNVINITLSFDQEFLFSSSSDGLLFCWKFTETHTNSGNYIYSDVTLQSLTDFEKQNNRLNLLDMSKLQNIVFSVCESKFEEINENDIMKKLYVEHELAVIQLNKIISELCQEKSLALFASSNSIVNKEIEEESRLKVLKYSSDLDCMYRETDNYVYDTHCLIEKYQQELSDLEKLYIDSWNDNVNQEEIILARIRKIENVLIIEKAITQNEQRKFEMEKDRLKLEAEIESTDRKALQKDELEKEIYKTEELKKKFYKLKNFLEFTQRDNLKKQNIGQIDFDSQEKLSCTSILKLELVNLKKELKQKEKEFQKEEVKFCELKKIWGNRRGYHSLSKNSVDETKLNLKTIRDEMEWVKRKIQQVTNSIEKSKEDIRVSKNQCLVLDEKLNDSVIGFQEKQLLLKKIEKVFSTYKSLLHGSLSQNCDVEKLKQDIQQILDQNTTRLDDDVDSDLRKEFSYQIDQLKKAYDNVKGDPKKAMKDLSTAEFKLSQENSKLLHEVYDLQKETERLRRIISEMEESISCHQQNLTGNVEKVRNEIEFVLSWAQKDNMTHIAEIEKLDIIIEEQRSELQRLRNLFSRKQEDIQSQVEVE